MTSNINSEVIMPSESRNWFVAMLSRIFHRTKNNPKINNYHNPEERKIVLEGALNSLIVKPKVEQWQHNKKNDETTSNFESTEQGTQPSSLADAEPTHKSSGPDNKELVRSEADPTTIKTADLTAGAARLIYTSVLNNDQLVLNLADDQLAKQKLESCVVESKTEDSEMAQTKSITEMNETEVHDYAKERVQESPLKKTLAGIKFPKRKVTKVEQVEKDKEV